MKKILFALVMILALVGCANQEETINKEEKPEMMGGGVQVVNPFKDYETLEEAFNGSGLKMNLPESVDTYKINNYRAMPNKMLEVIYVDGENSINVRKTEGIEDNSGYYGSEVLTDVIEEYDDLCVTIKSSNDLIYVATWNDGTYSYSITSHSGISIELVHTLIDVING